MGKLKQKAAKYADAFDGATVLADEAGRARKAAKIRAVLDAEQAFRSSQVRILDIGCSFGIILEQITPDSGFGVGVDMDHSIGRIGDNLAFARADAENLPFESGSFDIVICNHVYEHTDDAAQLLAEIRRVMHDDAVCYFAGPNKYEPVEPHYGLPFLSWLPRPGTALLAPSTQKAAGRIRRFGLHGQDRPRPGPVRGDRYPAPGVIQAPVRARHASFRPVFFPGIRIRPAQGRLAASERAMQPFREAK
jgi:SAM-dependent methyltransferase